MTKIEVEKLGRWRAVRSADSGWCVVDSDGKVLFANLSEEIAHIVAASPAMLRFLSLFRLRDNAPAGLDVGRVLQLAGINLVR